MTDLFLDREQEFETIVKAVNGRRSLIVHGEAGCGKTALFDKVKRHFEARDSEVTVLSVSPTRHLNLAMKELALQLLQRARPPQEMAEVIKLLGDDSEQSVRRFVEHSSGAMCRGILLREFKQSPYAIFFDHTGFLSQVFCDFCKRLIMEFHLPLVFAGRSCHMEDVGYISRTLCGPGERLPIKNLDEGNVNVLIEHCMRKNGLWPSDVAAFKEELRELSGGIAGRIVKMCEMASLEKYRFGREIKLRLIHIDSQLGELDVSVRSRHPEKPE